MSREISSIAHPLIEISAYSPGKPLLFQYYQHYLSRFHFGYYHDRWLYAGHLSGRRLIVDAVKGHVLTPRECIPHNLARCLSLSQSSLERMCFWILRRLFTLVQSRDG
jgi:hypothetical protein